MLASPAFAAKQYWIVQQSINSCTVVDEILRCDACGSEYVIPAAAS
jgi:hypothetical protein